MRISHSLLIIGTLPVICTITDASSVANKSRTGHLHNNTKVAERAPKLVDDRKIISRTAHGFEQLNAIGIVNSFTKDGVLQATGTGFMISDCLMMTSHHVIFANKKADTNNLPTVEFLVGYTGNKGRPFEKREKGRVVEYGDYDKTAENAAADWAIVRLDNPIGKVIGVLPLFPMSFSQARAQKSLVTAGFHVDKRHDTSVIWGSTSGEITGTTSYNGWGTNCFSTAGASGSPLLARAKNGRFFVIAILKGHFGSRNIIDSISNNEKATDVTPILYSFDNERIRALLAKHACQ